MKILIESNNSIITIGQTSIHISGQEISLIQNKEVK